MLVSPAEPETMSVSILNAPQTLRIDVGKGPEDLIVLAAIALPTGHVTTLALSPDGDYLAMPAVDASGAMTSWEPAGTDAPSPPENEPGIDKMHRLGRWLAGHYLEARQTSDQDPKA